MAEKGLEILPNHEPEDVEMNDVDNWQELRGMKMMTKPDSLHLDLTKLKVHYT